MRLFTFPCPFTSAYFICFLNSSDGIDAMRNVFSSVTRWLLREPVVRLVFLKKAGLVYQMVKVKVHTLEIAPLRSESPLQKRSGMARVLKGFHTFTCTPTRSSAIGMSHTCLSFPVVLIYRPRRDGRLSRPWCEVAQVEIRTCNLPIGNPARHSTTQPLAHRCSK